MNQKLLRKLVRLLLFMVGAPIFSNLVLAQSICPDPDKPCGSFKPYELPFVIRPSTTARAEDRSADFYAVILKSSPPCSIPDDDRISAQKQFPRNKVFISKFECGPEDNIRYDTIDHSKYGILAVYSGASKREAESFLAVVRNTGRFSGAYIRRMRAVLVHP